MCAIELHNKKSNSARSGETKYTIAVLIGWQFADFKLYS
jgi:hypothetical protein